MVTESIPIVTTPTGKDKGVAGTPEGSVKKKKRRSLFRRPSKRKLLGASPSSADRYIQTYVCMYLRTYVPIHTYIYTYKHRRLLLTGT